MTAKTSPCLGRPAGEQERVKKEAVYAWTAGLLRTSPCGSCQMERSTGPWGRLTVGRAHPACPPCGVWVFLYRNPGSGRGRDFPKTPQAVPDLSRTHPGPGPEAQEAPRPAPVVGSGRRRVCGKAWKGQGAVWLGAGPGVGSGGWGKHRRAGPCQLGRACNASLGRLGLFLGSLG